MTEIFKPRVQVTGMMLRCCCCPESGTWALTKVHGYLVCLPNLVSDCHRFLLACRLGKGPSRAPSHEARAPRCQLLRLPAVNHVEALSNPASRNMRRVVVSLRRDLHSSTRPFHLLKCQGPAGHSSACD